MEHYSNIELTEGIKNRDEKILGYVVQRCKPAVTLMIKRMGGDEAEAEDIFHDGLLEIFERVVNKNFMITGDLQNILHVICSNFMKNKIKKNIAANNYYSSVIRNYQFARISYEKDMNEDLYKNALRAAKRKLSDLCRKLITLNLKGLSVNEMYEYLDYSYNYIRKKHPECMDSLKKFTRMEFAEMSMNK